jgi:hypothetical protein
MKQIDCNISKESATNEGSETMAQQLKQQKSLLRDNIEQTSNEPNYDVRERDEE